jgi:hypothetical protein
MACLCFRSGVVQYQLGTFLASTGLDLTPFCSSHP